MLAYEPKKKLNELTGWKNSTGEVQDKVIRYLEPKLTRYIYLWVIIGVPFVLIGVTLLVNLLLSRYPAELKDCLICSIFTIILLLILICKTLQKYESTLSNVKTGNIEILNCSIYRYESDSNWSNTAYVYVKTEAEEYCSERLCIYFETDNEWREYCMSNRLFLIKIPNDLECHYELLTDKRLNSNEPKALVERI